MIPSAEKASLSTGAPPTARSSAPLRGSAADRAGQAGRPYQRRDRRATPLRCPHRRAPVGPDPPPVGRGTSGV